MKNQKGFSLLEVTATVFIVGVISLITMSLTKEAFKGQKSTSDRMDLHSDMILQENALSALINTLDRRYTFTGPGLTSPSTTYESRWLIPLAKQCRDLSTAGCENDTSLLFVNYKAKNNPAVELSCNFPVPNYAFNPPPAPLQPQARIFLFNLANTDYGTASATTSPSAINTTGIPLINTAGKIDLNAGAFLAVQDGAQSSLWRVIKGLKKLNPPLNPIAAILLNTQLGNCYPFIGMATNNNVYYLYALPLTPNYLPTPYFTDLRTYPMKLSNVQILSIGRKNSDQSFGVNSCKWSASAKIECNQAYNFPELKKVTFSRMDEQFTRPLSPDTSLNWYDVGASCTGSDCMIGAEPILLVPSIPAGQVQTSVPMKQELPGFPTLLKSSFSFYKQEYLHRIRFRLMQEKKRRDIFIRLY